MPSTTSASAQTAVVGVSVDSPFANKEFAAKNGLNFPLLSDITRDVIKQYDVVFNDLAGVKGFTVAKRAVFVIDRQGTVRYKWVAPEPKVEPNYAEVTAAVKKLAQGRRGFKVLRFEVLRLRTRTVNLEPRT